MHVQKLTGGARYFSFAVATAVVAFRTVSLKLIIILSSLNTHQPFKLSIREML